MTRRLLVLSLVSVIAIGVHTSFGRVHSATADMNAQNHEAWLASILQRMDSIQPGMTRADLLKVFRTDGQPSREMLALTGLRRTFISRDCPYFRVEVEFEPATPPDRGAFLKVAPNSGVFDDAQDVIVKISKPYVELPPTD